MEDLMDFSRSFIFFETKALESIGRFNVECKCSVNDSRKNTLEEFYLGSAVFAGHMFTQGEIPQLPAFMFQGIFTKNQHFFFRDFYREGRTKDNADFNANFKNFKLHIKHVEGEPIKRPDDLQYATDALLTGRTFIPTGQAENITVEYPVKHINLKNEYSSFQIETGPVLLPVKKAKANKINNLSRAYLFYNNYAGTYFLYQGKRTNRALDYTHVDHVENAKNQLFTIKS